MKSLYRSNCVCLCVCLCEINSVHHKNFDWLYSTPWFLMLTLVNSIGCNWTVRLNSKVFKFIQKTIVKFTISSIRAHTFGSNTTVWNTLYSSLSTRWKNVSSKKKKLWPHCQSSIAEGDTMLFELYICGYPFKINLLYIYACTHVSKLSSLCGWTWNLPPILRKCPSDPGVMWISWNSLCHIKNMYLTVIWWNCQQKKKNKKEPSSS